jgi:hypothetical protein
MKGKEQDHLKKTRLGALRQGQRLDTFETKPCSSKEHKSPNQSSNTTKTSPAHMQAPPEPKHTPPEQKQQCNTGMQQKTRTAHSAQGGYKKTACTSSDRLGRLDHPMWPALHQTAQNFPEPIGTPSKHSQVPKACTNLSPLLTMHESRQNAKLYSI